MTIIMNPGSGPVQGATEEHAAYNMGVFTVEVMQRRGHDVVPGAERRPDLDDEGRFGWALIFGDETYEIEMPGLPLADVRYMGLEGQNILGFPRLYVNGSSWIWKYALGICCRDKDDS